MKKAVLILFLLALVVTAVFAQTNQAVADLRRELHSYIDAIPEQNLYALKSLLSILAEPPSNKSDLHEILESIPDRNVDALRTLLLALADPSYNATGGANQSQAKPAAAKASTPAKTNEPVKTGNLSVGGGAFFDWNGNSAVEVARTKMGLDLMSFGAYGFLDTKFFEVSIGASYGIGTFDIGLTKKQEFNLFQLDVNLLGKFPIDLPGGKFSVFPMLGISYNQPLLMISGDTITTDIFDLGQLGVLGGAGLDYNLTSSLYLRGEGLFNFRLPFWGTIDIISTSGVKINFGMGPRIKLAVGYRL